jgi:hypothetical protein
MRYLLLLYNVPMAEEEITPELWQSVVDSHLEFTRKLTEAGAFVSSAPLERPESAKTVRIRRRERLVVDGPFADTKEWLGGYYLIEAESLDDAVRWAHELAPVADGSIEVRPLLQLGVDFSRPRSS